VLTNVHNKSQRKSRMKNLICVTLAVLVAMVYTQSFRTDMCAKSNGAYLFVNREGDRYKFRMRDLQYQTNLNGFGNLTCSGGGYANCPIDRSGYTYCYSKDRFKRVEVELY
jgi:hypothetical protein